jgi:hypothetical protein
MFAAGVDGANCRASRPNQSRSKRSSFSGTGRLRHQRRHAYHGTDRLHGAASRGAASTIQFLSDHGARLDIKDRDGKTPLEEAGPIIEEGKASGAAEAAAAAEADGSGDVARSATMRPLASEIKPPV